ncbi:MAG: flagellar biosynthesis anti-sigma factor FlgM [Pseudomonadota bacterium]
MDADRVSQIREAIKDGTYPLVPTKIADAIIAARVGFGVDAT